MLRLAVVPWLGNGAQATIHAVPSRSRARTWGAGPPPAKVCVLAAPYLNPRIDLRRTSDHDVPLTSSIVGPRTFVI